MTEEMRRDLLDYTRDDERPWTKRTAHGANAQFKGALRPSEIWWTKASQNSKIRDENGNPILVALTLGDFVAHLMLRDWLYDGVSGLTASLKAQKNNSPQCGVSFARDNDRYCVVRSIFEVHRIRSITAFLRLAQRFPKLPSQGAC